MKAKALIESYFKIPNVDIYDPEAYAEAIMNHVQNYAGDVVDEMMPEDQAREEIWTLAIDQANDLAAMVQSKTGSRIDQKKVIAAAKKACHTMGYTPKGYRPPRSRPKKPEPKTEEPRVVKPTGVKHGVYTPPGVKPKVQEDDDRKLFKLNSQRLDSGEEAAIIEFSNELKNLLKSVGYTKPYSEVMVPENVGYISVGHGDDEIVFDFYGTNGDIVTGDIFKKEFTVTKMKGDQSTLLADPITVSSAQELRDYVS